MSLYCYDNMIILDEQVAGANGDRYVDVKRNREVAFRIERIVYERLFGHTAVRRRTPYLRSLETGTISYREFFSLTCAAEVPYPLFLAPADYIEKEISSYEKKVFYGVHKEQLSLATRGDLELADISLILKDLTRKQTMLRKHIQEANPYPNLYKNSRLSLEEKAADLRKMIGYNNHLVHAQSKEETFNYLRSLLASNNIYVSLYMHHFSPQEILPALKFSGICIKDNKCPYIFLRAGDESSAIELWGRRLFTMALLLACMCNGKFGAVTMNGRSKELINDEQYELAEEFLMPKQILIDTRVNSIDDIEELAATYSVSPSALVMRLFRLNAIDTEEKNHFLNILSEKFAKIISKKGGGKQPPVEKAIVQYNSPKAVNLITGLVHSGTMSDRDARNLLYYQKGDKFNLDALAQYASS